MYEIIINLRYKVSVIHVVSNYVSKIPSECDPCIKLIRVLK
jgi:hypothetical protein